MLIKALISLLAIFLVLVISEYLARKHQLWSEYSRKLVHISVATFVAFWPFYLSYKTIALIAAAFFVIIFLSRELELFKSIHNIHRKTIGDLLFPISIFITALIGPIRLVFMVVMLIMGIADGLAGSAGIYYNKQHRRKNKPQNESTVASITFLVITFIILFVVKVATNNQIPKLSWPIVFILPILTTVVERVSPYGSDDLSVPLFVLLILSSL